MTITTNQEINFTNYFGTNSGTDLENKKKKASRACLHCQRVIFIYTQINIKKICKLYIENYVLILGTFNLR